MGEIFKSTWKFNIVIFFISFCMSIIIVHLTDVLTVMIVFSVITISIIIRNNNYKNIIKITILALALFSGILRVQYDNYILSSKKHVSSYIGQEVMIDGYVIREMNSNSQVTKVIVKIKELSTECSITSISNLVGFVILEYESYANIELYDNISIKGALKEVENYSSYDYKGYLEDNNIYSIISGNGEDIVILRRDESILRRIYKAKDKINHKMFSILPSPHSELLMGILYGSGMKISDDLSKKMSNVGITHIIAVSGYNISLLMISTGKIARVIGRKLYTYSAIVLIILFIIFVGIDNIPVVRAGLMYIIFLICRLTGRKRNICIILSFTIFMFMLKNPDIYKFVSFQLTFASTSGILIMGNFYKKVFNFLPDILLEYFSSTISAISLTLPVIIFNFGKISLVSPIVNLFVLPIISFITVGGLILVFLLVLNLQLFAYILGYVFWLMIEYVLWVVNVFNHERFGVIELNSKTSREVVGVVVSIINLVVINIRKSLYDKNAFNKSK